MKNFENRPWPIGTQPAAAFADEGRRGMVLEEYQATLLADDPELVAITEFAAKLCGAPVALISLVERNRQRYLAKVGVSEREIPRSVSFCAHAMHLGSLMEVRDATLDPRFIENPLVTGPAHLRFYAGQPLITPEGAPLGALCVSDTTARPEGLNDFQREGMDVLAQAVMRRLRSLRDGMSALRNFNESEAGLRALADSMPSMAWASDADGNINFFNRQMVEFTGLTNFTKKAAFHPDDYERCVQLWNEAVQSGGTYRADHRILRADGTYSWVSAIAQPVRDSNGKVIRWFGTATDVDKIHRLSEAQDLLARELSHRIKNIFAVVAGLISLSTQKKPEHKEFSEELIGTIRALGRAHDYVRPVEGARGSSLHGILHDLFVPYGAGEHSRVSIHGADAEIAVRSATPLALVFHELATNSAKYGALSTEEGRVELTSTDQGESLLLTWVERGGPTLDGAPSAEGFGSRLVEMSIRGQLGGNWERRFEPEGLTCELMLSKAAILT